MDKETRKATPGVHFPDRWDNTITTLEVPVGTKQGDLVVASDKKSGVLYPKFGGEYRVASVLEPGENASTTFAMCYKNAVPKRAAQSQTAAITEVLLAGQKSNAEANAENAKATLALAQAIAGIGQVVQDLAKNNKK